MFIYSKCLQYGCNLKDRYFDDQQGIKIKIFMPQHFLKRVGQEIFRNRNTTNANQCLNVRKLSKYCHVRFKLSKREIAIKSS